MNGAGESGGAHNNAHNHEHNHEHKPLELSVPAGGEFVYGHPGGAELTRRLIERLELPQGAHVLDFGCGAGDTLLRLREAGFRVAGTDADRAAIAAALSRDASLDVRTLVNNVVDFPSNTFDAVIAECSLSLVENRAEYLHEFYCVLKPGGGKLGVTDVFRRGRRT